MAKLFLKVVSWQSLTHGGRALVASDKKSDAALRRLEFGDIVVADVRRPRNPKHNAKFWVLMQTVWESTEVQDRYASPRALAKAIELALGYFDTIKLPDGTVGYAIHSLNFESMPQDEFSEFYKQAIDVIVTQLTPHLNREDLEKRVMELVNG